MTNYAAEVIVCKPSIVDGKVKYVIMGKVQSFSLSKEDRKMFRKYPKGLIRSIVTLLDESA